MLNFSFIENFKCTKLMLENLVSGERLFKPIQGCILELIYTQVRNIYPTDELRWLITKIISTYLKIHTQYVIK